MSQPEMQPERPSEGASSEGVPPGEPASGPPARRPRPGEEAAAAGWGPGAPFPSGVPVPPPPDPYRSGDPYGAARVRRGGGGRPGDLSGRRFPDGDWEEPAASLDELYRWVERGALTTATWYLAGRAGKRRAARLLRAGAGIGALAGAALPLLELTGTVSRGTAWGYLGLLVAVACVAADRYFGLTAGWMRDMATAQAVQRRLQVLQFDWASESVREVLGPAEGTASEAAERCLGVLRRFCDDVTELVRVETADWMGDFRAGALPLGMRISAGVGQPEGGGAAGTATRVVSARAPHMPRQRPESR
ncbi:SLATT domain-containing protein [Streptomyces sp. NPDC058045]|uniref:SLATT domain-containing protein n=1 Tax=Streptomyces sp. NPDC058045 TaxID=3346311 RepID=UPI0036E35CD1